MARTKEADFYDDEVSAEPESSDSDKERYNLVLPKAVMADLKKRAAKRGITFVDLMRKYIKLGNLADDNEDAGGETIVRDPTGKERSIILY